MNERERELVREMTRRMNPDKNPEVVIYAMEHNCSYNDALHRVAQDAIAEATGHSSR